MARTVELRGRIAFAALAALAASTLATTEAAAQIHWDASAQIGPMKRFLADRPAGGSDALVGGVGQLTGHVALLPLLRVGGYLSHDFSPLAGDASARQITSFGARAAASIPWVRGAFRPWLFAGFGYAGVYAPSYRRELSVPSGPANEPTKVDALVQGAGGGFFEVPLGIGASYKLYGAWALSAELGARIGFGHSGSVYEDPGPQITVAGQPDQNALPSGIDRLSVGLTAGIMIDL